MQITVAVRIDAPPERVFALATDVSRWADIISAIRKIEILTPGPIGVGTRFRETRVMFGRDATEEMAIEELVPPSRFVLTAQSHGTRYRAEHLLASTGGKTELSLVFEGRPISIVARLMAPVALLMRNHLRRQLEGDLMDLKRAAEA